MGGGFGNAVVKVAATVIIIFIGLLMLAMPGLLAVGMVGGTLFVAMSLLAKIVTPFQPKDDDED
ncbi:MAG: hypothetical protein ACYC05_04980 [Sulfuricella sp.]